MKKPKSAAVPPLNAATARKLLRPKGLYAFAAAVARGEDPETAAREIGGRPAVQFFDHPEFTGALIAAFHHQMTIGLAPKALTVLEGLLSSNNEKIRLAAAKTVLDKALPDVRMARENDSTDDLNSMSIDQLASLVDKLEDELAGRAHDVTPADSATLDATDKAKALAMLE